MALNKFKVINDTKGHAFGDEVLVEAASRLKKVIGANDQQSTYWQAGKSVAAVDSVKPVLEIVQDPARQTKQ